MVGLVGELGGHEDLGRNDFFPDFGSDKRSKVSRNTLNEGSKSTILILLPKFSGRILTNIWGFYCSFIHPAVCILISSFDSSQVCS